MLAYNKVTSKLEEAFNKFEIDDKNHEFSTSLVCSLWGQIKELRSMTPTTCPSCIREYANTIRLYIKEYKQWKSSQEDLKEYSANPRP